MFEVKNFNNWLEDIESGKFGSGASEKIWLINPETKEKGLFKFPKIKDKEKGIITGEYWAEKLAAEIGKLIDVECARVDIGTYKGRFEAAEGGTLFLDEIGDIPRNVQSKLLRTLETRTIERVGSTQSIPVDFRLISATNVDLEQAMKDGDFRSDLYYRLCTIKIVLPPMRERKEDLTELIRFYSKKFGE